MLTEIQNDALKELLNISIGQAAHTFSQLVHHRIELSIPCIRLIPLTREASKYPQLFSTAHPSQILTSTIQFGEKLQGKAILLFPLEKTRLLIDLFLQEEEGISSQSKPFHLSEMDYDALKEIGNLLLNAIMGGLGNLLGIKLLYHPPQVEKMLLQVFWDTIIPDEEIYLLILYSSFNLRDHNIEGTIVVQISMQTISFFLSRIDAYVGDLDG